MQDAADFRDLTKLLRLRAVLGPFYGSEDLCLLLYSLVRRERPQTVVELGTGLAVTTLWMAQAIRENRYGHVYSIDDLRQGPVVIKFLEKNREALHGLIPVDDGTTFRDYLERVTETCGLSPFVTYRDATMAPDAGPLLSEAAVDFGPAPIDILFADFKHDPDSIMRILTFFLPRMAECSSIFIDSASTTINAFLMLERLVSQLNSGKVPQAFLAAGSEEQRSALIRIVAQRQFRLTHLIERKARTQNSTAWLRIEPVDWKPHPATQLHRLD